jgi:hypothetical protein
MGTKKIFIRDIRKTTKTQLSIPVPAEAGNTGIQKKYTVK